MALTRRDILKAKVKAKLDEVSAFDNLHGDTESEFIAGEDVDYPQVNPIGTYIDTELDNAANYCLNNLPMTLLSKDVEQDSEMASVDRTGVGHIEGYDKYTRLVRVSCLPFWSHDVTSFISSSDPDYQKQQNPWNRGGVSKPVVAIVPEKEELELYSFRCSSMWVGAQVYYIDCGKAAEKVKSAIDDYIVIRCAATVSQILGSADAATVLMQEYANKIENILI